MRLQIKILLLVIPFIVLSLVGLGLWSINKSKELTYQKMFQYLELVLEQYSNEHVKNSIQMLSNAGLEGIDFYVKDYQQKAAQAAVKMTEVKGGHLLVLDDSGKLVFSSLKKSPSVIEPLWGFLSKQGAKKNKMPDGQLINRSDHLLYSFNYHEAWGWTVIYSVSNDPVNAQFNDIMVGTFQIAFIVAVLASLISFVFSRYILISPINILKDSALNISQHERISRIPVNSRDELGLLARGMERMSNAINRYKTEREKAEKALLFKQEILEQQERELTRHGESLEKLVRERTKTLQETNQELNLEIENHAKAEIELKNNEESLRTILNSIGDAVIATDLHSRIIQLNPVAEKLTGWTLDEARGELLENVFNIINSDTRKVIENPVDMVLVSREVIGEPVPTTLISKGGDEFQVAERAAPIMGVNNNVSGVVLVFRDVTEQRKMEEELFKVRKLKSVGVLAGGIAHDFNNILTGLFGNLQLAKMRITPEHRAYKNIAIADRALNRATNLTKQLLTFAKGGDPILESVDLEQVVRDSINFSLSGSMIKTDLLIEDHLWQISADKGQLSQIVANLSINAMQAMQEGGTLHISLKNTAYTDQNNAHNLSGEYVELSFRDEGTGIAKSDLGKIFDPYFTTKKTGSGLGLATVHKIIENHNGSITVDSKPAAGTTFTISLPAEIPNVESDESKTVIMEDSPRRNEGNILVMDDDKLIRDLLTDMLQSMGHRIATTVDGEEAIQMYTTVKNNQSTFDLVIMDLTIPGSMGGKGAMAELLKIDAGVKVIVSSGYSTDPILANYSKSGFKGRLVKPFTFNELEKEVRRVMAL
ncbi:MAG: response regulator [Proteobacteria bacterium]|nr:response regulator [Pseudomonadota bacterium]